MAFTLALGPLWSWPVFGFGFASCIYTSWHHPHTQGPTTTAKLKLKLLIIYM